MEWMETYSNLLEKYPCDCIGNGVEDRRLNHILSSIMQKYYVYVYGVERKEKSFKFYPVTVTEEEIKKIYDMEFKELVLESIKSSLPIEVLLSNKIKEYTTKFEECKAYALATPMEPYYGNPTFIVNRVQYILECIQKLPTEVPNLDGVQKLVLSFMGKYGNQKNSIGKVIFPFYTEEYKRDYRELEKLYCDLLEMEKSFSKVVETIWKSALTDPNHHNDHDFKYLIHTFSGGMIPLDNIEKVCCSLATNRLLTPPYGNTGIICDFDIKAVETICFSDAGSWMVTKDEFVRRLFPITWQVTNPNGVGVWFENEKNSRSLLPVDLEIGANAHNIAVNGELLNYSVSKCYSEIFFNHKVKVIGAFYTDDCKDTSAIEAYAAKYNLPLVYLSLTKLRRNVGLLPLDEKKEEGSFYHY